jgi:small subunit ribosomal protein S16
MATKIRLQRHGRKKRAFFHIVVADSRAPRDGRFIEKLGTYNPITNPATIDLNLDLAVKWLLNGAQPTDTAAAILGYKGAKYKKHLQVGVIKGSITQEEADKKFAAWMDEKTNKVETKKSTLADAASKAKSDALKAEAKKKEEIAAKILAKTSELAAAAEADAVEEASEEAATEGGEEVASTDEAAGTEEPAAESAE